MRNRNKYETLKLAKDQKTKEIIHALWRGALRLYGEKYNRAPELDEFGEEIDPLIRSSIAETVLHGLYLGQSNLIEGNRSAAIGQGLNTKSFLEIILGAYAKIATGQNATEWIATDFLATLGNGTDDANRSNAMEVFKSGLVKIFNALLIGDYKHGTDQPVDGMIKYNVDGLFLEHLDEWLNLNTPLNVTGDTINKIDSEGHTHKLELPVRDIATVVRSMAGSNKESFLIDNTANISETITSNWTVIPDTEKVGEFKAVVMVRNKTTDTIITLISLLSFDYTDAVKVILQSDLQTDAALSLTLGVDGALKLFTTIAGMPADYKRLHFCFERCVFSIAPEIILADLLADVNLGMQILCSISATAEIFTPTIEIGMGMEATLYPYADGEAVIEMEMDMEATLSAFADAEAVIEIGLGMEADLIDAAAITEGLLLTWDDIVNVPVADASSVSDWNTFFDLPTNGTAFTSIIVTGNEVKLIGGSDIILMPGLFSDTQSILKVIDTKCIISIMDGSFFQCYYLNEVNFPVCTTIGNAAFYQCYSLDIIKFPICISVGVMSFAECSILSNVTLPNLQTAGDSAFTRCDIIDLYLPKLITAGNICFRNNPLETVNLPLLENAGQSCFEDSYDLVSIIATNLKVAGIQCFLNCPSMSYFDFPLLQSIGKLCFSNSISTTFNFPLLETIGDQAFGYCTNATSFYLPNCTSLGEIEDRVFEGIIGQTITLTIPAALMTCNGGAPDGDIQYLIDNNTVTIIQV